ncbi:hypothetical protein [Clostridioides sp. ZZV15-6598]|uniref:hypothetical protein n=1 Tax=Clostridioides sp. ZZV15-6598 TaxID=2811501 RepID=UPI001D119BEE|nr:hypothetical protein [Clostridioides sp. ZZV15-6598]
MNVAISRILNILGDVKIIDKIVNLNNSDINSFLLSVFQSAVIKKTPQNILAAFSTNRFTSPSHFDPIAFHNLEVKLLSLSEKLGIKNLLLSPSAPLGSCSVFGCVNQNNVISALRGTETLSDPSNMIAIIIADGLKKKILRNEDAIHYATTTRVVRAQTFEGKGFYAHFGIFCIVSSGKDKGSYLCESELLIKHLNYYKDLFTNIENSKISICLRKRGGYPDRDGFFEKMTAIVKSSLPEIQITIDLNSEDNAYYKGINFKIYLHCNDNVIEIADGGFVNWISEMTGNKKNRCLISGIGIDRLLTLEE